MNTGINEGLEKLQSTLPVMDSMSSLVSGSLMESDATETASELGSDDECIEF